MVLVVHSDASDVITVLFRDWGQQLKDGHYNTCYLTSKDGAVHKIRAGLETFKAIEADITQDINRLAEMDGFVFDRDKANKVSSLRHPEE